MTIQRLGIFALPILSVNLLSAASVAEIAESLTPKGASVSRVPVIGGGDSNQVPAGCFIGSKSKGQVVFAYVERDRLYLQAGTKLKSRVVLPGTYLQTSGGINGIKCRDILRNGSRQVIALSSQGASVGSWMNVFTLQSGKLRALPGTPIGFHQLSLDCSRPNEACLVVSYGKWTAPDNAYTVVYEWNGSSYSENPAQQAHYAALKRAELRSRVFDKKPMEAANRASLAWSAVQIFAASGRRTAALHLCDSASQLLLDESLSTGTPESREAGRKHLAELAAKYSRK